MVCGFAFYRILTNSSVVTVFSVHNAVVYAVVF